ncbi:MAG: protein kinase domain-containing protein [Kofleriaceae bacterium]
MGGEDTIEDDHTELTKREGHGSSRARPPNAKLERGAAVGRYIIIELLGEGGMGVVYRAYDPELDRRVAIKLLQAKKKMTGDQAWLLREAQAMAKLSHPNVIAVHDVGVFENRVFVAMELVTGVTLRSWLRAQRPWREVLRTMRAAGAGLAAAHAAGLIHRDFKPDNVLVGDDGRVRVGDFGLARRQDEIEPASDGDADVAVRSPLSAGLTVAGTLVGTPAYMAPELTSGTPADARSDQFSFGVALYEALFRARPFAKDQPKDSKAPSPTTSDVPAAIQRVVMRAISPLPADRFSSMDELLAALVVDEAPRGRGVIIGSAIAVALGGAAMAAIYVSSRTTAPPPCGGIARRLDQIWDGPTKQNVRTAFLATKQPYAETAFGAVERDLDRLATDWTSAALDNCEATRVRREQPEEIYLLRQMCLDQRLVELRSLSQMLRSADADVLSHSDQLSSALDPVDRCSNVAALLAPGLPPSEPQAKVEDLRQALADSRVALAAARYAASAEISIKAASLAQEVRYAPFEAEARLTLCAANNGLSNTEQAAAACSESVWLGVASRRDDIVAQGAISAAAVLSQSRLAEAKWWMKLARSVLSRMGHDAVLEVRALEVDGLIAALSGDTAAAVVAHDKAIAAAERLYGRDNPRLWVDEEIVGATFARVGAYDKARPHLERAMALHEKTVGPDHPDIAVLLTTLGACYTAAGDDARARSAYERALAIRERTDGQGAMLILTLNNMADGMIRSKNVAGALIYADRAAALAEKLLGHANPVYHAVASTRAEALLANRRIDDARAAFDTIIEMETRSNSPILGPTLNLRAHLELGERRWAEAAKFALRAIAASEATSGKESPELWQPLATLAHAYVELGRRGDAKQILDRALAIGAKAQISATDLAPVVALRERLGR